ncbi:MAG: SDR family oxidoreductase [Myxococcota bacterium]
MGIGASLSGKHVVLTGVTGFVGKVFAVLLLDRFPEIGRLTLLIRGGREGAVARFERIADTSPAFRPLKDRHGADLGEYLADRVQVLDADLLKPGLGLDPSSRSALSDADAFVHCAGVTDFDPDPKKALDTNTLGALAVAELARHARAPFLHVSTCYVAGTADGRVSESLNVGVSPNGTRFDPKSELDRVLQLIRKPKRQDRIERGRAAALELGWPNIYTWSKGLAEHLLAGMPGLDLTIVRPSIVECAASFPFPGWNEGINTAGPLAWLISTAFRRLPAAPDHRFDVVPVDLVARGMLVTLAAALQRRAPRVVQLASSDVNPLTFGRTIELTGLGLRRYTRKGNGTALEKRWFRHLDPVAGTGGWFVPFEVRGLVPSVRDGLDALLERELPESAKSRLSTWRRSLERMSGDLDQIDDMLTIYAPFIAGYDWEFETTAVRALSDALPADERDLAYDIAGLDWRSYWIDVEFPGLMTWSIPILRGREVPVDPASSPPLRLVQSQRAASK